MTQAQRMRKALDKTVIPKLREAGFEGKYPHYRRNRDDKIDLIAFTALKYGNGFDVAGSVIFPQEKPERQNIIRPNFSADVLSFIPNGKRGANGQSTK